MRTWVLIGAAMWSWSVFANEQLKDEKPVPQITATKKSTAAEDVSWYATLEFRHHLNTYYDGEDYLGKREPSAHARLQVGTTLYDGLLDTYATLGVFKVPRTQQVFQRRPQLAADLYPVRHPNFTLLQYNLIQLPFNEAEQDPEADATKNDAGTIYTVGVTPSARWSVDAGTTRFVFRGGLDGWTKMYSRAQKTTNFTREEDDSRLGLSSSPTDEQPAEPFEVEDYAQHYSTQAVVGVAWEQLLNGEMETGLTANYRTDYLPFYEVGPATNDYKYTADRYSFYKWRLKVRITDRLSFVNDFYHFHDGLFAAKRQGEDSRRFRNIARIQCKL